MKKILGMAIAVVMAACTFVPIAANNEPVSAASKTPSIEDVEYKKGKIEVEFRKDVKYKNVKVSVKDSNGKKYSVYGIKKDNDEIEFKIRNPKSGVKYNFVINGVKSKKGGSYTKVKGSVKSPAAPKAASDIGLDVAKKIALEHAGITDVNAVSYEKAKKDREDGIYVYEIEFVYDEYEYEYEIKASSGKILEYDIESIWD